MSTFIEGMDSARTRPVWVDESPAAPVPDSKAIARDLARVLERYLHDAGSADERARLVNVGGLLRHASAWTAALGRELDEAVRELADLKDQSVRVGELEAEVADLRAELAECDVELARLRDGVRA